MFSYVLQDFLIAGVAWFWPLLAFLLYSFMLTTLYIALYIALYMSPDVSRRWTADLMFNLATRQHVSARCFARGRTSGRNSDCSNCGKGRKDLRLRTQGQQDVRQGTPGAPIRCCGLRSTDWPVFSDVFSAWWVETKLKHSECRKRRNTVLSRMPKASP